MKIFLIVLLVGCACTLACQKAVDADQETRLPTDTSVITRRIPKGFRHIKKRSDEMFQILFDSAGRRVQIYRDDTTTANLYDDMRYEMVYDDAGYIIGMTQPLYDSEEMETSKLVRNADHRLEYMTNVDWRTDQPDTIRLAYHQQASGLEVRADFYAGYVDPLWITYQYNQQQQLLRETKSYGEGCSYQVVDGRTVAFEETINGSVSRIGSIAYQVTAPVAAKDTLFDLLMGPDGYLLPLRNFYLFQSTFGSNGELLVSLTDPNQPIRQTHRYPRSNSVDKFATIKREFDGEGRLVEIELCNGDWEEYEYWHFYY